jgi:OOP family OmpA-OmpF porin
MGVVGCGGPVAFQGERTLKIAGTPRPFPVVPPAPAEAPVPAVPQVPAAPAPEPQRVELRDDKIVINEKIQFQRNKSTIKAVSFSLLIEVAAVIKKHPHIKKIRVEGHASSEGAARHNKRLSHDRARAVMRFLIGQGVPKTHLVAKGFGSELPIADNDTPEGREKNRRVEFNIIEQDKPSATTTTTPTATPTTK